MNPPSRFPPTDFSAALSDRSPSTSPTREESRRRNLTPTLVPTYSLPSAIAPPAEPYGTSNPDQHALHMHPAHTANGDSDRIGGARGGGLVRDQAYYLELARRLLHEPSGTSSVRAKRLAEAASRATFAVRFRWQGSDAESVYLAGSFNGWGLPVAMTRVADAWECVLRLDVGEYWYKFVVDGEWKVDKTRLCERVEGHGGANKLIVENLDRG